MYIIFFFVGANACVQLTYFEEAITWCEKGLVVSFIIDAFMEKIFHVQTLR